MIWLFLILLFAPSPLWAKSTTPKARWVKITASIGLNYSTTIYGYGPPQSRVELTSPRVFSVAYSDTTGYFEFKDLILPPNPQDLCLTAQDENNRLTSPVCFPPPPASDYSYSIGPILLPPTISLDDARLNSTYTLTAAGQSFPDSDVTVTFFQMDQNPSLVVKPVQALELPSLTLKSDSQGNFNFSLPTVYATSYRFFASSLFNSQPSPRSHPLYFTLKPSPLSIPWLLIILVLFFILTLIVIIHFLTTRHHTRHFPWLPPSQVKPLLTYHHLSARRFFPWSPPSSVSKLDKLN